MAGISLEDPKQFMISWTSYGNELLDPGADDRLGAEFAKQLTDANVATESFWPEIAKYGTAYNLLGVLRKVSLERMPALETLFRRAARRDVFDTARVPGIPLDDGSWQRIKALQQDGRLYEIDLKLLESLTVRHYENHGKKLLRFNPATVTLLEMTKGQSLLPFLIWVYRGHSDRGTAVTPTGEEFYSRDRSTEGAWLYALQASKSSITLYGIWLGHVYYWHIVSAAMQRTMKEAIRSSKHPIQMLLAPQSEYLIQFNRTLLGKSSDFHDIAPPTWIFEPEVVLKLLDAFAEEREFFDDDPYTQLAQNGLKVENFTNSREKPWDLFPVAQNLLRIWDICERFVQAFVLKFYPDNAAVTRDTGLQNWMKAAGDPAQGNIRGLPKMDNPGALTRVLTSQVYRLTVHGVSRLPRSADPWLTFVANFPPCLQRDDLPSRYANLSALELLKYLPNVGTIAEITQFYFIFAFTKPYASLLPRGSMNNDPYFPKEMFDLETALTAYRNRMLTFMTKFTKAQTPSGFAVPDVGEGLQWPRNIEL